jgi:integrase
VERCAPTTLSTLLGLLASTGLRGGEAIRFHVDQGTLDLQPPHFHIRETTFHKSRLVPLHPSTAERLRHYGAQRAHRHYDGLSEALFVSDRGQALQYLALHNWFARLCQRLAIAPTAGGRRPCLMSFRHTCAVTCLQRWYQQGLDVHAWLPRLSVYLGHVHPQESYWYLTAVPELLGAAAQRCQVYAPAGGDPDAA